MFSHQTGRPPALGRASPARSVAKQPGVSIAWHLAVNSSAYARGRELDAGVTVSGRAEHVVLTCVGVGRFDLDGGHLVEQADPLLHAEAFRWPFVIGVFIKAETVRHHFVGHGVRILLIQEWNADLLESAGQANIAEPELNVGDWVERKLNNEETVVAAAAVTQVGVWRIGIKWQEEHQNNWSITRNRTKT